MTATLDPVDAQGWLQWVTNFDGTYQSFTENFNALATLRPWVATNAPQELATVDGLLTEGATHAATLAKLKETRDYVVSWLNWLSNGINSGVNFLETNAAAAYAGAMSWLGLNGIAGIGSLAVAPVVVIIGLTAAAAALVVIGYWVQKAYREAQRLNALQALVAQGSSAAAAAAVVDQTLGPAGGADGDNLLGIPWQWVITGAVLIFVGPKVIEAFENRGGRRAA